MSHFFIGQKILGVHFQPGKQTKSNMESSKFEKYGKNSKTLGYQRLKSSKTGEYILENVIVQHVKKCYSFFHLCLKSGKNEKKTFSNIYSPILELFRRQYPHFLGFCPYFTNQNPHVPFCLFSRMKMDLRIFCPEDHDQKNKKNF